MAVFRSPGFRGRSSERAVLDRLLTNVRGGQSAVLVVRGEAGVGKSELLRYAARAASGFRIAHTAGVESEMELPFAGLHQLCAPMLDRLDALPEPQRQALGVAFGLASGAPPDRFLVALAALSLLADAGAGEPLLCLVDDAQWLDGASAQVLGFVARRVLAESLGIVFAVREPSRDRELAGLPELALAGLADEDARMVLATVVPGRLDDRVRDRIVAETRGNPLALLELPRGMTAAQLAGGFGVLAAQPLSGRIEERFLQRLDRLTAEARRLLLVAAAEPVGDPLLVWRAAERLGLGVWSPAAVEAEGLIEIGEQVTFRHPLVRSAVYRSAAPEERRAVHLALAEVTDPEVDGDRRAWHLASAAAGPDEAVALELEHSAGRAQARGGLAAAAAFLQRSVALTRDPTQRAERALGAAAAHLHAGAFDPAVGLLAAAEAGALDEVQRARVDLLRGQIAFASSVGRDAPPLLLGAARRLEPLDGALARETYLDAFAAALSADRLVRGGDAHEVAAAVLAAAWEPSTRACDLLLDGLARLYADGRKTAAPALKRALRAFRDASLSEDEELRWLWLACHVARDLCDDEAWDQLTARQLELARRTGAFSLLPVALDDRFSVELLSGRIALATALAAEADAVVEATGSHRHGRSGIALASWHGHDAEAHAMTAARRQEVLRRGEGLWLTANDWGTAVLLNGLGRYDDALAALERAAEGPHETGLSIWLAAEFIEAAVRSGKAESAVPMLARLAEIAEANGTEWSLGMRAARAAMLAEGDAAEALYREAIERLARTRIRVASARAHLLYGEWLRRENRRVDAREQLKVAHELFVEMGNRPYADRARRELLATGETVRRRTVETVDELTPQETQIGRLAAGGFTNPEIGAQLFLSPRTVEWHLRKVFIKLGINSRRELRSALPDAGATAIAV